MSPIGPAKCTSKAASRPLSFGLAYVPEEIAAPHRDSGRLRRALENWLPPSTGCHLYYPSRRRSSPAFELLVDALRHRVFGEGGPVAPPS